jgi:hypothetical protein
MTRKRQPRRTGLVAAFVVIWSLVGLAFPLTYVLVDRPGAEVQASPRDVFTVTAPVALAFGVTLQNATLSLTDRLTEGSSVESVLAGGRANIAIDGGHLRFDSREAASATTEYPPPFVAALAGGQFETLKLRRSTFSLVLAEDRVETLTNVVADVVNRRRSGLSIQGTGEIRGLPHTFDIQLGAPSEKRLPTRISARIGLKGGLLTGTFDGRLAVGEPLNLQGLADVQLVELRRVAQAFGLDVANGPALGGLRAKGRLEWNRTMLAFDRASFQSDAGEAAGTLALDLETRRPLVTGTLAFGPLDLTRSAQALTRSPETFWSEWTGAARTYLPLSRDLDLDVRLSAASVRLGALSLGTTAATLTMNKGRLSAELAELELAGGRGAAQATVDLTVPAPRMTWRAKLSGIDAAKASTFFWGLPAITGPASIQADLSAEGAEPNQLRETARGTVAVRLSEGGRIGFDLKGLVAAATSAGGPWDAAARAQTPIDTLEAKFFVAGPVLSTIEPLVARSGDTRYELTGQLDRSGNGTIDARLRVVRESRSGPPVAETVRVEGAPQQLRLSREPAPDRADRVAPNGKPRGG